MFQLTKLTRCAFDNRFCPLAELNKKEKGHVLILCIKSQQVQKSMEAAFGKKGETPQND